MSGMLDLGFSIQQLERNRETFKQKPQAKRSMYKSTIKRSVYAETPQGTRSEWMNIWFTFYLPSPHVMHQLPKLSSSSMFCFDDFAFISQSQPGLSVSMAF